MPHTEEEEKLEMGRKELDILKGMFKSWLKSDFTWAVNVVIEDGVSGEEGEWDFMFAEWRDKLENWMSPYVFRLYKTGYITQKDLEAFGSEAYSAMSTMLSAVYALGKEIDNV